MSLREDHLSEPDETVEPGPEEAVKVRSHRKSFSRTRRALSEEELKAPAVQRLLLDEVERLESENAHLRDSRTRFHEADKTQAVLREKLSVRRSQEIISGASLAVGSAALGFAPSLWEYQSAGPICLAAGSVLVVLGILAKVVQL